MTFLRKLCLIIISNQFKTKLDANDPYNDVTDEDLVKEMLRPMLKSWLDENLPPMVERLVRQEIERVSRGR